MSNCREAGHNRDDKRCRVHHGGPRRGGVPLPAVGTAGRLQQGRDLEAWCPAETIAWAPEARARLTVSAATEAGRPA